MRYRSCYVGFIIFTPLSNDIQQTISNVLEFSKQQTHKGGNVWGTSMNKMCKWISLNTLGDQPQHRNTHCIQSALNWDQHLTCSSVVYIESFQGQRFCGCCR